MKQIQLSVGNERQVRRDIHSYKAMKAQTSMSLFGVTEQIDTLIICQWGPISLHNVCTTEKDSQRQAIL